MTNDTLNHSDYEMAAILVDPSILGNKDEIRDEVRANAKSIMYTANNDGNGLLFAGILMAADYVGIQDARRMVAMMDRSQNNTECTNQARKILAGYLA